MPTSKTTDGVHGDIRNEAADWVARLQRPDFDPATGTADLQRWADQSPAHAAALADTTGVWEELAGAGRLFLAEERVRSRRIRVAGAIAAMAAGVAAYFIVPALSGRVYETPVGTQEQVILADGSVAYLNSNTRMKVRFTSGRRSIRLDKGEAYFKVAKNANWPFVVTSGSAATTAVGTEFSVQRVGDVASIILVEGKVLVRLRQAPRAVELRPGQNLNSGTAQVLNLTRRGVDKALAWRDGRLVFDNETLESAAAQFNEYTTVPIVIEGSAAAQVRVSGIFSIHDLRAFTLMVGDLYGLKIDLQRDKVSISGVPKPIPLEGPMNHAQTGRLSSTGTAFEVD